MNDLLNRLAKECHAANETWWRDPATGQPITRNKGELLMLMVSEISEAMEGERKDLMDDKLPHRKMAEVELADALIRIFDFAGGFQIDLWPRPYSSLNAMAAAYAKNLPLPENKGDALFGIVKCLAVGDAISDDHGLNRAISVICTYAGMHGYDLDGAVAEKRAFNASRKDHKPEHRLAAGGKKW